VPQTASTTGVNAASSAAAGRRPAVASAESAEPVALDESKKRSKMQLWKEHFSIQFLISYLLFLLFDRIF